MTTWSNNTKNLAELSYLLMETGDFLLLETGDKILLQESFVWSNNAKETLPAYTNIIKN